MDDRGRADGCTTFDLNNRMISEHDQIRIYELLIRELEDFAVFLVGLDGRITSWNPGVQIFFGYPEADFIGRDFADIFTPEDRANGAPQTEMETARREGRASDVRWHLCWDQTRVFVEGVLTSIRDPDGELCGFSKIARGVRTRHAAGSMLSTILEGTEGIIYAIDCEGRFIFANSPAARLLGHPVEDLIGRARDAIFPPDLSAEMRATDQSVLAGNTSHMVEEKFPSHTGERTLLMTKTPWRDAHGRTIGLVAYGQDITARVSHRTEREQLLREIRRSNEELTSFSHVVAHDLRTPLRAVRTYTEMLSRHLEGQLDATAKQFMTFVKDGADHMEALIDSLLRYAEAGDTLSATHVNASAVVQGLLQRLDPLIQETRATIIVGSLPEVWADPVRLLQVFQNLLVNAINYRGNLPPFIRIAGEQVGSEYRFSVADNGMGIAREHFERIFIPLKRLHSDNIPGSGIGLALCRKIVERHGGRMWLESVVGKGSTFYFTLPMDIETADSETGRS